MQDTLMYLYIYFFAAQMTEESVMHTRIHAKEHAPHKLYRQAKRPQERSTTEGTS